jgi:hypothetical protein
VTLPKLMLNAIPREYFSGDNQTLKILWEEEWRAMGITQVGTLIAAREMRSRVSESGMGALRGARAGAPYSPVQVGRPVELRMADQQGVRSITKHHRSRQRRRPCLQLAGRRVWSLTWRRET